MNKILIVIMLMISSSIFSQVYEYSLKKDYSDPDKINMVDASGITIGYYKVDILDKSKVNVYNANGITVGYYKTDYNDASKVNVYSTANNIVGTSYKSNPLEIPRLSGMFDPVPYKPNPDATDNLMNNIQNSRNANNTMPHQNIRQEDCRNLDLEARIKYESERTAYLRDSIIKSRQAYFNQPKALPPYKLVVGNREYFFTESYVECHFPQLDEIVKGRMWCYDYNHKATGFWMENAIRGNDFYKLKD